MSDSPCAGCPWLRVNQTPEAVAASPLDGRGVHWFDSDNLRGHWDGCRDGHMLPCHATDPRAPFYGGKPAKPGHGRVCVGITILAKREVVAFMVAGNNMGRYRRQVTRPMTLLGLASWASRLLFVGATLEIGEASLVIPEVEDNPEVQIP